MNTLINVKIAGLGGQGVVKASDILAEAAFRSGLDVKKSELHGMSQRGGSVSSDVRFGGTVWSPMIPAGEADYLLVTDPGQVDNNLGCLRPGGVLVRPDAVDEALLPSKKTLNAALLGVLSAYLPMIPEEIWLATLRGSFAERYFTENTAAFRAGQAVGRAQQQVETSNAKEGER